MQTQAHPASADACTPMQRAIHGAAVADCLGAKFHSQGGTWTFMADRNTTFTPGRYVLLPEIVAQLAIAQEEAETNTSPITLAKAAAFTSFSYSDRGTHRSLECWDALGNCVRMQTPHLPDPNYTSERPGLWYGHEMRVDAGGREWRNTLDGRYVMDDFGYLVPVPA